MINWFFFTARDVIHSWALPQMGIKVDCIPGRITHTIFSSFALGVFYGQCSEWCGPLHGFMPICVEVIPFNEFLIWILMKYKHSLHDLGVYTDVILTKKVFSLLGENCNNWWEHLFFLTILKNNSKKVNNKKINDIDIEFSFEITNHTIKDSVTFNNYTSDKKLLFLMPEPRLLSLSMILLSYCSKKLRIFYFLLL